MVAPGADSREVSTATLSLVPPDRVGALLRVRREAQGLALSDVAARSGLPTAELAALEAGHVPVPDGRLDDVMAAYGAGPSDLVPPRSGIVVDLEAGALVVAEESAAFDGGAPAADEILAAYLSLLYTLRRAEPGTRLVLRRDDLRVLAASLRLAEPDVESRLTGLMDRPTLELGRLHAVWRAKVVVPVVGAVVLATALGAVLVLRSSDDAPTGPGGLPPTTVEVRPGPVEVPVPSDVSVLPPVVVERTLDGAVTIPQP